MPEETVSYSDILIELNKAVKMHNFYPEGHPRLDAALGKCYLDLRKCIDAQGDIHWTVDQKGFYSNQILISQVPPDMPALAKKIFFRRIKEITFTSKLTMKDMRGLLSVIKLEPEDVQKRGGIEAILAEQDVEGLLFNELSYEDLKRLREELEAKKQGEKNENAEDEADKLPPGEADASGMNEQDDSAAAVEAVLLETLLEQIRTETDFLKYNDLAVRIREKCDSLMIEGKHDELLPVMIVYFYHLSNESDLPDNFKKVATDGLISLLNLDNVKYLVARISGKDPEYREEIQKILLYGGDDAMEELLNEITTAQDATIRRFIYNAIIPFGKALRPHVEKRLHSDAWYIVRQMVSIIGEVQDPDTAEALVGAYNYPDIRVKRAVLKSLGKIASPMGSALLVKSLDETDDSLVNQAIISLSILKDPAAPDSIGKVALKRETTGSGQDPKKEAIKALGNMKDKKALPYLTQLLFKKVWFGKKAHEEVRVLAAAALGAIGGDEAYQAVKQAYSGSSGELYTVCKRILEGREKSE